MAAALAVAGCGAPADLEHVVAAPSGVTAPSGSATVAGCRPYMPLIPSNTNETCGGLILEAVSRGLVRYGTAPGKAVNDIAASVATRDAKKFTVKLKPGVTFSDGTAVKTTSFVNAWNFAAYGRNAQLNSYYFEAGKGFRAAATSAAKTLSGLRVVNDTTFTVELTRKDSMFRQRLGQLTFAPLPGSFFADRGRAYAKKPIGAGPFTVVSASPASRFVLAANPGYTGVARPTVAQVTVKVCGFSSGDAAYDQLRAGEIDAIDYLPNGMTPAAAGSALGGRTFGRTLGILQSLNFPSPKADTSYRKPGLRKAISMAIDRKKIVAGTFAGGRVAATGWTAPGSYGYQAGGCGTFCTFRPAEARRLFRASVGHSGAVTIAYNGDSSHAAWVRAACASIRSVLGVACRLMDYPSIENFLAPQYRTGGQANDNDYSNRRFDPKLAAAAATVDPAAATRLYREAERRLRADMPSVPLWCAPATGGYSGRVASIRFSTTGTYDLTALRLR